MYMSATLLGRCNQMRTTFKTHLDGHAVQRNDPGMAAALKHPGFTPKRSRCHTRLKLHSLQRCTAHHTARKSPHRFEQYAHPAAIPINPTLYLDGDLHASQPAQKNDAMSASSNHFGLSSSISEHL